MSSGRSALLAAAVVAGALAGAPAAQADVAVKQPFLADAGNKCGITKGVFVWYNTPRVDVNGVLHDEPCDTLFSTATFTAFAGRDAVAKERVRADDGPTDFLFSLTSGHDTTLIDRITVQVCRFPVEIGISYCGPLEEFRSPFVSS